MYFIHCKVVRSGQLDPVSLGIHFLPHQACMYQKPIKTRETRRRRTGQNFDFDFYHFEMVAERCTDV